MLNCEVPALFVSKRDGFDHNGSQLSLALGFEASASPFPPTPVGGLARVGSGFRSGAFDLEDYVGLRGLHAFKVGEVVG